MDTGVVCACWNDPCCRWATEAEPLTYPWHSAFVPVSMWLRKHPKSSTKKQHYQLTAMNQTKKRRSLTVHLRRRHWATPIVASIRKFVNIGCIDGMLPTRFIWPPRMEKSTESGLNTAWAKMVKSSKNSGSCFPHWAIICRFTRLKRTRRDKSCHLRSHVHTWTCIVWKIYFCVIILVN